MATNQGTRSVEELAIEVPAADIDAEIDPHWLDMQPSTSLPAIYLPAAMPGYQAPWRKIVAVSLCAVFVLATAAGVCLTYGPSW
ncbi:MAG TPA: hypothetical protein VMT88_05565 [Actinomycetes bacterium]|nr:hypothetical protein [Actinomycetes bacterium]